MSAALLRRPCRSCDCGRWRLRVCLSVPDCLPHQVRLYSVDHADLFITNERNSMTTELLAGIPHSLLLSNSNGNHLMTS